MEDEIYDDEDCYEEDGWDDEESGGIMIFDKCGRCVNVEYI